MAAKNTNKVERKDRLDAFSERLRKVLDYLNVKQKTIANELGLPESSISEALSGKKLLSKPAIYLFKYV